MRRRQETVIRGLACTILVEEVVEMDATGRHLFTLSSVYVLDGNGKRLVKRSRLPNALETLKKEIRRDGIQVFQQLRKADTLK